MCYHSLKKEKEVPGRAGHCMSVAKKTEKYREKVDAFVDQYFSAYITE